MNDFLKAVIFGIVQGLAEFLPISSSGHLALTHSIISFGEGFDNLAFDVLLHLGTLFAVIIIYRKDIVLLIKAFFTLLGKVFRGNFRLSEYNVDERFVVFLMIAVIPLIPGAFLSGSVEFLMGYPVFVGCALMVNAVILFLCDKLTDTTKSIEEVRPINALAVGLCQLVAVLPGISRSGSTITGGLTQGFTRELAVKFSFILSIPAILGACVLELPDFFSNLPDVRTLLVCLCGALCAMVVGILAIKLVNFVAKKAKFRFFSYYCLAVGAVVVIVSIATA